jgi:RHS repeat-associated protein
MSTPANLSEQVAALPSGAGAVRALGETFTPELHTGTGRYQIAIACPPGPAGIAPALALTWSSSAGNGDCGLGWTLDLARVQRRTDKGLPTYDDARDRFALQGDELVAQGGERYRFRIEGRFSRIRRVVEPGRDAWVVVERDGIRTFYGETPEARLSNGAGLVAAWYVTRKQDVFGNTVVYTYERDASTRNVRLVAVDWAGCYRVVIVWEARPDPIVSARAGFQVRCEHRVRSIDVQVERSDTAQLHTFCRYSLEYERSRWTGRSLLVRVTPIGIDADGASMAGPATTFGYTDADLARTRWHAVSGDLPTRALSAREVTLVRQSGSGLPDVLETRATGHYLRVNMGQGRYAPAQLVPAPPLVSLSDPGTFVSDMDGDGYGDLVVRGGRRVYRARPGGGWGASLALAVAPAVDLDAATVRVGDLTGNGLPDALSRGVSGWAFYENLGGGCWAPPVLVAEGPPVRLDDPRVHLVDVDGDGLADLVHVDPVGVTVWPSLGRGRFGAPVRMPVGRGLGALVDPRDVRFVDVTGSGQADLVHTQDGVVRVAFNLAGLSFADPVEVGRAPLSTRGFVEVSDLLGTGAEGLLFTDEGGAWRFLELFTAGPLDLLGAIDNGLGKTTAIHYGSSAAHWARARAAGRPWRTSMPTSVRVVERITATDRVTTTTLETRFEYAHGVYDGVEREFRGFARVVVVDREAPRDDPEPIAQSRIVRWFHTGSPVDLRDEWWAVPGDPLEDDVPDDADARRAAAGLLRREETYALDGNARPYEVAETAYRAFRVGRSSPSMHAAWTALPVRQRRTLFERTAEHRQVETLTRYDLDRGARSAYGLPVEVREIGHGRGAGGASPLEALQSRRLERVTCKQYVSLDGPDADPWAETYTPSYVVGCLSVEERAAVDPAGETRLSKSRWFYDGERYRGLGYPGTDSTVGVTHGVLSCQLRLAFTAAQFDTAYPAGSGAARARDERGHFLRDGDEFYVHEGRAARTANGQIASALDPNGAESRVTYDTGHGLFATSVVDALGHPTVLERGLLTFHVSAMVDANGNRTEFTYDPLCRLRTKAVMGKFIGDAWEGDTATDPTEWHEYATDRLPIRVTTRTRHSRDGATLDVHRFLDGFGRVVQERHTAEPDVDSPDVPRFRVSGWRTYNHKGLVDRSYQPVFASTRDYAPGDRTTAVVVTSYDARGRVTRVTHPEGTFATIAYRPWSDVLADRNDNAGHIPSDDPRYGPYLGAFRDHVGTVTERFVDALGRAIGSADDNGGELHVARTVRDLNDRVIEIWDARGLPVPTWACAHDLRGQLTSATHATAMGTSHALSDAAGNGIWARDAKGVEVERAFDALHRPMTVSSSHTGTTALRRELRYPVYDAAAPGFEATRAANRFGRVQEVRDGDGVRVFTYDWRGLLARVEHRFWTQDDPAGRPWHDPQSELWTGGAYDEPPLPATAFDDVASFLALPGLSDTQSLAVQTIYDVAGRPVEVRYPEGLRTLTTYGASGRVAAVAIDRGTRGDAEPIASNVVYDAAGHVTEIVHGNGVITHCTYDDALERVARVTSRRTDPASGAVTSFEDLSYAYDPEGHTLAILDEVATRQIAHNRIVPNTRTFRYDPRYRLVEATGRRHRSSGFKIPDIVVPAPSRNDYEPYRIRYAYDAAGNAVANQEYAAGSLFYKAARIDLFNGDEVEAGTFTNPDEGNFRYDACGLTTHTPWVEAVSYTYDHQVRHVNLGGGGQVRYCHHADQRTVRFVMKNGVRGLSLYLGPLEYHYRLGNTTYAKLVLRVAGPSGGAQAERVLEGVDPDSVDLFFRHADCAGSAHVLTTASGDLLSQEEYFPYGRASDRRDQRNRYRFIGVERDEDTGLCMTGPRTYDPITARFLQPDPLALERAVVAPFVYASASPVCRADPSGYGDESQNNRPKTIPGPGAAQGAGAPAAPAAPAAPSGSGPPSSSGAGAFDSGQGLGSGRFDSGAGLSLPRNENIAEIRRQIDRDRLLEARFRELEEFVDVAEDLNFGSEAERRLMGAIPDDVELSGLMGKFDGRGAEYAEQALLNVEILAPHMKTPEAQALGERAVELAEGRLKNLDEAENAARLAAGLSPRPPLSAVPVSRARAALRFAGEHFVKGIPIVGLYFFEETMDEAADLYAQGNTTDAVLTALSNVYDPIDWGYVVAGLREWGVETLEQYERERFSAGVARELERMSREGAP